MGLLEWVLIITFAPVLIGFGYLVFLFILTFALTFIGCCLDHANKRGSR